MAFSNLQIAPSNLRGGLFFNINPGVLPQSEWSKESVRRVREVNPAWAESRKNFSVCFMIIKLFSSRTEMDPSCKWHQSSLMPHWQPVYLEWHQTTTPVFPSPIPENLMEGADCCVVPMTNRRLGNQLVVTAFNIPLKPGGDRGVH